MPRWVESWKHTVVDMCFSQLWCDLLILMAVINFTIPSPLRKQAALNRLLSKHVTACPDHEHARCTTKSSVCIDYNA